MHRIIAALSFFTRLPFWRLATLKKEHYERVIPLWPLVGWITGGIMALVFLMISKILPLPICIITAISCRVLVTGALHEDGFADFCDGFGGGTTRERTLEIMKDSHIGTYGVLGLILYYLLFFHVLQALAMMLPPLILCATIMVVDTLSKYLSSTIIYYLPYARNAQEAKNRLIYTATPLNEKILSACLGILPLALLAIYTLPLMLFLPIIGFLITALLFMKMYKRINGYTGDCCGATFIITETLLYTSLVILLTVNN